LRAVIRFTLLRILVVLSFVRGAGLRFDFALVIGISFGCAATIAATTEAPPQRRSRRGRIPKRSQRPELATVPLCLCEEASPFWIILLLVEGDPEHPGLKLAASGLLQKTLTNVRFPG
jgi:hypothetical protein